MNKYQIRYAYRLDLTIGYDAAINALIRLGFNDYSADQFLFAEG